MEVRMSQPSRYASLLNQLDDMQQAYCYAARYHVLRDAEHTIRQLECEAHAQRTKETAYEARIQTAHARIAELEHACLMAVNQLASICDGMAKPATDVPHVERETSTECPENREIHAARALHDRCGITGRA